MQVVGGVSQPGKLEVADIQALGVEIKHARCGSRCTPAGLVTLDPFSFAVLTGNNDVVILGNPTLKLLDIDGL